MGRILVRPAGGGSDEPTPSGTILFDSRAGGAQSFQAITTIAQARSIFTATGGNGGLHDSVIPGGRTGTFAFTTDYDGAGKHALRVEWPATPGAEGTILGDIYLGAGGPYSHVYVSMVMHMGRTATGGGIGSVGAFTPVRTTGGAKRMMLLRQLNNGLDRLYWVMPTGEPTDLINAICCDNLGLAIAFPADYGVGVDVRWTMELISGTPNPGTWRMWRNGVKVLDSAPNIGSLGFAQLQFYVTRMDQDNPETEYMCDLVAWTP